MPGRIEEDVLRALRRINRLVDLQSRRLVSQFGLTGPQLVCLRAIHQLQEATPSVLSREISLSQATITGVIDRLVARQLVKRERSEIDRRQVTVSITDAGKAIIELAPSPLQDRFVHALTSLDLESQQRIRSTLEQIIAMMGGTDIQAAAVLSTSPAPQGPEEVKDLPEIDAASVEPLMPPEIPHTNVLSTSRTSRTKDNDDSTTPSSTTDGHAR